MAVQATEQPEPNLVGLPAASCAMEATSNERQGQAGHTEEQKLHQWDDGRFRYRPDIDGLRSLAVLSVLIYHVNEQSLPGGFVGVDIFFVISGYVVTASLQRTPAVTIPDYFAAFYSRRLKRLLPSLLLVSLAVGLWISSLPLTTCGLDDMYATGLSALLGFANNYLCTRGNSGGDARTTQDAPTGLSYFDIEEHRRRLTAQEHERNCSGRRSLQQNPFMHTWSLGVEEQFYLVFPLFLLITHGQHVCVTAPDWGPKCSTYKGIAFAGAASLVVSWLWTALFPEIAFFAMPSRFWQLASGALLFDLEGETQWTACVQPWVAGRRAFVLDLFTAALCGLSLTLTNARGGHFPLPWGLLPVAATLCFIASGSARLPTLAQPFAYFMSRDVNVYVGKISYSLYLWHWPLIVMFKSAGIFARWDQKLLCVAISFVLAILTYHTIECSCRKWQPRNRRRVFQAFIPATGIIMLWLVYHWFTVPKTPEVPELRDRSSEVPEQWDNQFTLQLINQSLPGNEMAACLDGSPPAYYWREGFGKNRNKILMHLPGGGACTSDTDCARGAFPTDPNDILRGATTSELLPPKMGPRHMEYEGGGINSVDEQTNAWSGWSVAHFHYCDQGAMLGLREQPVNVTGFARPVYLRGHYNFLAILGHLLNKIAHLEPIDVVLTGCSTGGLAVFHKCDLLAGLLAPRGMTVKCIPSAGILHKSEYITMNMASYHNWRSALHPDCLEKHWTKGQRAWLECAIPSEVLRHIRTPVMVINSLYDSIHVKVFNCGKGKACAETRRCAASQFDRSNCTWSQNRQVDMFRASMIEILKPATAQLSPHGVFAPACVDHCVMGSNWNKITSNGVPLNVAARRWYFDGATVKNVDAAILPKNPTCEFKVKN